LVKHIHNHYNDCKYHFEGFINAGGVSKVFEIAMSEGRIKFIE